MAGPGDFDDYGQGDPASYLGGGYGDGASYQTDLRAGYGNSPLFAMGGGLQTVPGQSYNGNQNTFSAIGSHIRPLTFTPPAFVVTGYSGRYVQQTGMWNSLRNMVGIGPQVRGARDYDISQNAAGDLGERSGLIATGIGMSAFESGIGALGSMAGGILGGFGAYAIAGKATSMVREAVQQRREIEHYLDMSSDRYITAGSPGGMVDQRRGQGFSTSARREVAEFIREMDIKDPLLNTRELTGILKGATEAGMFTGTRDMDDFKKKFKDIVENVKAVTTTLHQTLEEGVKTLKDLRGIGVDPAQSRDVIFRAETFGRASGRTAGEMMNLGFQGAELYRGTGVDMRIGFEANLMNAAAIRSSRDAGMLSQEAIAQAGGEEALAQRMTAGSLGYAQSSMGRGMAGAVFGGSGLDMSSYMKFVGGDQTMGQVGQTAAHNLGSPAAMVAFQAHQAELFSAMGKIGGGAGIGLFQDASAMLMAQQIQRATHGSMEDSLKTVFIQQMGKSESEANAEIARIKNADKGFKASQRATEQTRSEMMIQEASQNFFFSRIGAEIGDKIKTVVDVAASPINRLVDASGDAVKNFNEKQIYGIERVDLSGRDEFVGTGSKKDLVDRGADLNEGGLLAVTPGSSLRNLLREDDLGGFGMKTKRMHRTPRYGDNLDPSLNVHIADDLWTSAAEIQRAAGRGRVLSRTLMQAEAAAAEDKSGAIKAARGDIGAGIRGIIASGQSVRLGDIDDLVQRATGKSVADLKPGDVAYDALLLETKGMPEYERTFESAQRRSAVVLSAASRYETNVTKRALSAADDAQARIAADLGKSGVFRGTDAQSIYFGDEAPPQLSGSLLNKMTRLNDAARALKTAEKWGGTTDVELKNLVDARTDVMKGLQSATGPDGERLRDKAPGLMKFFENAGPQTVEDLQANSAVNRELSQRQQERGLHILGSAIDRDFAGVAAGVGAEDRGRVYGVMDRIASTGASAVMELNKPAFKADLAALGKTPTGLLLKQDAELMQKISGFGEGLTSDELIAKLRPMKNVGEERALTIGRAYEAHGTAGAINAVTSTGLEAIAGTSASSAAGATAGVGTAAGTAADQYSLQTSQNLAVLAVLQGLAAKLKVQ